MENNKKNQKMKNNNKKYKMIKRKKNYSGMFTKLSWKLMVLLLLTDIKGTMTDREGPGYDTIVDNTNIFRSTGIDTVSGSLEGYMDGQTGQSYQLAGSLNVRWRMTKIHLSGKMMNRLIKSRNGNINGPSKLKIIHWNGGGRLWQNKLIEVEHLVREYSPDICYISEANLWQNLDEIDMNIPGYSIHLPNTMISLGHARLVLLTRDNLNVKIIPEEDKEAAMLWCKVGSGRKSAVLVGGIYRQHQLLGKV